MKVLLAEDDAELCAAFAATATAAGHTVLTAADCAGAWALHERERPPLVVLDLELPPGDGLALCRRIRAAEASEATTEETAPDPGPPDAPHAADAALAESLALALGATGEHESGPADGGSERGSAGAATPLLLPPVPAEPCPTFVLVIAPRERSADLGAALDAGADDYLMRPARPGTLAARLTIAERRIAQDARRRRAEAALRRARWLAGIGETSIALQHQINNPLAALLGHAALIEEGLIEPGEERAILAVVTEQARRIAAVVRRLAELRDPRSVEYLRGARMLDLGER